MRNREDGISRLQSASQKPFRFYREGIKFRLVRLFLLKGELIDVFTQAVLQAFQISVHLGGNGHSLIDT